MTLREYPELDGHIEDPQLRAAFAQLTPALNAFAERHSLLVLRYKRGFAMWQFLFRHPTGGCGTMQANLGRRDGTMLASTWGAWHLDDDAGRQRWSLDVDVREDDVAPDSEALVAALERTLCAVLGADAARLTRRSMLMARPRNEDGSYVVGLLDRENLPVARA